MKAILTGIDTYPANSLALVLRSIGYEIFMLSDVGIKKLNKRGYTGGVTRSLLNSMGYKEPNIPFVDSVDGADLFVDLKKNDMDSFAKIYPDMPKLVYVINGGWDDYENYAQHYPVITTNFWIKDAFHFWSPLDNVNNIEPRQEIGKEPPICLLHNARNWGFNVILDRVREATGLRVYGSYGSPDGLIHANQVPEKLKNTLCMIHLKASDCPGWALWEAFATATPIVATELLVKRMKFEELYKDGETCLLWGRGSYDADKENGKIIREYIDANADNMLNQIVEAVEKLKDPEYNYYIGMNGYKRWKELTTWGEKEVASLKDYFIKHNLPL